MVVAVIVKMTFSLQDFIDNPTLEKVDACRKDDLLCIAAQFNIPVQNYGVKKGNQK